MNWLVVLLAAYLIINGVILSRVIKVHPLSTYAAIVISLFGIPMWIFVRIQRILTR